jgi:hypothetical protein
VYEDAVRIFYAIRGIKEACTAQCTTELKHSNPHSNREQSSREPDHILSSLNTGIHLNIIALGWTLLPLSLALKAEFDKFSTNFQKADLRKG